MARARVRGAPGGRGGRPRGRRHRRGRKYRADALFASNGARHRTADRRAYAKPHYTPELLATVKQAYWMDYEMLDAVGYGAETPASGAAWARVPPDRRLTSCAIARDLCPPAAPEPAAAPAWVAAVQREAPH